MVRICENRILGECISIVYLSWQRGWKGLLLLVIKATIEVSRSSCGCSDATGTDSVSR